MACGAHDALLPSFTLNLYISPFSQLCSSRLSLLQETVSDTFLLPLRFANAISSARMVLPLLFLSNHHSLVLITKLVLRHSP